MLRQYIYNEIKNATHSELTEIQKKIVRAENFGHIDSKSVDTLLTHCKKRFDSMK